MEGGEGIGAVHATCPLTQKDLLDITDPVQDSEGCVFDGTAIRQLLGRQGAIRCPRTNRHMVRSSQLKPAEEVIRYQERHTYATQHSRQ